MLQAVLLELVDRVVARVVDLGLGGDDLVEQLAVAVVLAGLDIRPGDRKRLADRAPARGGDHDHASAGRSLEHELPLLLREVSPTRHRVPVTIATVPRS